MQRNNQPTVTPITVRLDYSRTLAELQGPRDPGSVLPADFHDHRFPVERVREDGECELFIAGFHRDLLDDEDPSKSELLRALSRLGLQPEGPLELLSTRQQHPNVLHRYPIVARRQVYRDELRLFVPFLRGNDNSSRLFLHEVVGDKWFRSYYFLASCKPCK